MANSWLNGVAGRDAINALPEKCNSVWRDGPSGPQTREDSCRASVCSPAKPAPADNRASARYGGFLSDLLPRMVGRRARRPGAASLRAPINTHLCPDASPGQVPLPRIDKQTAGLDFKVVPRVLQALSRLFYVFAAAPGRRGNARTAAMTTPITSDGGSGTAR